MAKRQTEIPGTERPNRVKELDTAAEAYVEARDRRMKHTEKEVEAKTALISVMKKHNLTVYEDSEADPPIIVTLSSKDQVKVTESDEGTDADGDEGEALN